MGDICSRLVVAEERLNVKSGSLYWTAKPPLSLALSLSLPPQSSESEKVEMVSQQGLRNPDKSPAVLLCYPKYWLGKKNTQDKNRMVA